MTGLLLHNGDKGESTWAPSYPSGNLLVLPCSTDQVHAQLRPDEGSVQFSRSVVSDSATHESQHARLPCPSPTPRIYSNSCPSMVDMMPPMLDGEAIQPSHPLTSPSSPAPNTSQHQGIFKWVNPSHEVAKVLKFQLQHQSFQWTPSTNLLYDGMVGSPCNPKDSQESSPTPQFKSINCSALSFLHSPTLTSIHNHWKNHMHSSNLQILRNKVWVTTPCR